MRNSIEGLLYQYKVDLVLNGHVHAYEVGIIGYILKISELCPCLTTLSQQMELCTLLWDQPVKLSTTNGKYMTWCVDLKVRSNFMECISNCRLWNGNDDCV